MEVIIAPSLGIQTWSLGILASISHPNIINYREAFFDDRSQTLCIVMEIADAGDIQKKISDHQKNKTHFNES